MSTKKYCITTFLIVFLVLPLVSNLFIFLEGIGFGIMILISALTGFFYAKMVKLPGGFYARYLPILLPVIYLLTLWVITMFIAKGNFASPYFAIFTYTHLQFFLALFLFAFSGNFWGILGYGLLIYLPFIILFFLSTQIFHKKLASKKGWLTMTTIFVVLLVIILFQAKHKKQNTFTEPSYETVAESEVNLYDYDPENPTNLLIKPDGPMSLELTTDFPILDGATAAYPVYAAMANAIYKGVGARKLGDYVYCNKTESAYENLIHGTVDMIFGAEPSKEQRELAAQNGVELILTPIAKEAFVFFVNKDNPVSDLSVKQIQEIYLKKIRNWKKVGGIDQQILAFQRPVNSGSQTIMLSSVMKGKKLPDPLREEYATGMGGLVDQVASYRNYAGAIGYSFRFYTTSMKASEEIKLIRVEGIEASITNIQDGSYPFTVTVYAIMAGSENQNAERLKEWILSEEGQTFIEKVGYVGIR